MFLMTLFAIVVRELLTSTRMPGALLSGLPMTWLFAMVVLMLRTVTPIPPVMSLTRFPETVALRAWTTSIENAGCPLSWMSGIVKPETLTSLTRFSFSDALMQMASGAQGESALALGGGS